MRSGSTIGPMPDRPKRKNPPMLVGEETLGERMARYRKEKRLTQTALAEAMGTIQPLISDYERDRLRPNAEVIVAFATVLDISTDELLGLNKLESAPAQSRDSTQRSSKCARFLVVTKKLYCECWTDF